MPISTLSTVATLFSGPSELRTVPIELPDARAASAVYNVDVAVLKWILPFLRPGLRVVKLSVVVPGFRLEMVVSVIRFVDTISTALKVTIVRCC